RLLPGAAVLRSTAALATPGGDPGRPAGSGNQRERACLELADRGARRARRDHCQPERGRARLRPARRDRLRHARLRQVRPGHGLGRADGQAVQAPANAAPTNRTLTNPFLNWGLPAVCTALADVLFRVRTVYDCASSAGPGWPGALPE